MIDQRKTGVMVICRKRKVMMKTDQEKGRGGGFGSKGRRLGKKKMVVEDQEEEGKGRQGKNILGSRRKFTQKRECFCFLKPLSLSFIAIPIHY